MTDHKLLQQDEINALLKAKGVEHDQSEEVGAEEYDMPVETGAAWEVTAPDLHEQTEENLPEQQEKVFNAELGVTDNGQVDYDVYETDTNTNLNSELLNQLPNGGRRYLTTSIDPEKLNILLDIPLKVSVILGRAKRRIKDVLQMTPGAIVELESLVDEPVEILVNGKLVAKGEVVVVNENFGVKITDIISTRDRINSLKKANE